MSAMASAGKEAPAEARSEADAPVLPSRMIWNEAPHCAFTDLARFKGSFYCTFREGTGHVPGRSGADGVIRVITSADGEAWESVALLTEEGVDLRDPKISITPAGRLMLTIGGSFYREGERLKCEPRIAFSDEKGRNFSQPQPALIDENIRTEHDWLWRVTWHDGLAWGVVYHASRGATGPGHRLVRSGDGVSCEHVATLNLDGFPNETTLRFAADGEMIALVRREGEDRHGRLGRSRPPYTDWRWGDVGLRLGGPNFLVLPGGELIVGSRLYLEDGARTALFCVDETDRLRELFRLPSGGDTSYPGLVIHEGNLWISYYSSHEGRAAIYFADVLLEKLEQAMSSPLTRPAEGQDAATDQADDAPE
jgi:hypothetical protein